MEYVSVYRKLLRQKLLWISAAVRFYAKMAKLLLFDGTKAD